MGGECVGGCGGGGCGGVRGYVGGWVGGWGGWVGAFVVVRSSTKESMQSYSEVLTYDMGKSKNGPVGDRLAGPIAMHPGRYKGKC